MDAKRTQPFPSPEVLELQHKNANLEKDYQAACRIVHEAQLRVEFLENLLDKKRFDNGDDEQNLVDELQKKVKGLTQQLKAEKSRAIKDRKDFNAAMENLAYQRNIIQRRAKSDRIRDVSSINALTHRLAQYESVPKETPVPFLKQSQLQGRMSVKSQTSQLKSFQIVVNRNPTNIFAIPFDTTPTISYVSAVEQLRSIYDANCKDIYWMARYRTGYYEQLHCCMCKRKIVHPWILNHFFSDGHDHKLRKAGTTLVSLVAFDFWKQKLESISIKPNAVASMDEMPMELLETIEQPILFSEIKEEDTVKKEIEKKEADE